MRNTPTLIRLFPQTLPHAPVADGNLSVLNAKREHSAGKRLELVDAAPPLAMENAVAPPSPEPDVIFLPADKKRRGAYACAFMGRKKLQELRRPLPGFLRYPPDIRRKDGDHVLAAALPIAAEANVHAAISAATL